MVVLDGKRKARSRRDEKYHSTFQVTRNGENRLVEKAMGGGCN
jgi:hypothetical protein